MNAVVAGDAVYFPLAEKPVIVEINMLSLEAKELWGGREGVVMQGAKEEG